MSEQRKTQLTPQQLFSLDLACQPIRQAFGEPPYLVGTVTEKRGWRAVDVRLMLPDEEYDRMSKALGARAITFLGFAISAYLRDATNLPIDFQFQRRTEANEKFSANDKGTSRNPLGNRSLLNWPGDARPEFEADTTRDETGADS